MSKRIDERAMLGLFLEGTRAYHLREVARLFGISPATARKYLDASVAEGLLTRTEERGHLLYAANWDDDGCRFERRLHNLRRIKESGLLPYLRERLAEPTIVLFGSWAKGENHERSDLDLFIRTEEKVPLDVKPFERQLGPIQLLLYDRSSYEGLRKNNRDLLSNIINGTLLAGYLDIWESTGTSRTRRSSGAPRTRGRRGR